MDAAPRPQWPLLLTIALGLAGAGYLGYHLGIGLGAEDTNHLETPLALSVARQVTEGPSVLYGPFSGARPLVLIHAPLYYRLAAVGAWPLARLGVDPVAAALIAGRSLAFLAFAASLVVVARIARLDEAERRAGLWSALLLAGAPVFGSFPATVRPDTLGVLLQTVGAWLVLRALRDRGGRGLVPAYVAFGLAFATKQHDVVVAAVSSVWLAGACWRRELRRGVFLLPHAAGAVVVVGYYGMEQWLTGGMMARSVFELPAAFGRITPADWGHVATTFAEIAKRSVGLIALAGVAAVAARSFRPGRLDGLLMGYLVAELAATALLCRGSTGAWVNYAMQAVVFGSVLTARALARAAGRPGGWVWAGAVGAAALVLVLADARLVGISAGHRRDERKALEALLAHPQVRFEAPDGLYFVGFPQHNRRYGRSDLAHDEWLYQSYEALGAAEPRRDWLRRALISGPVRLVVVPLDGRRTLFEVPGLEESLPELGYRPLGAFGRYRAWARRGPEALARTGRGG